MTQQTTPSITSVNVGNVPAAFGQFIGNYSIDNPPIGKTTPKLALTPKPLVEIVYDTALGAYLDATATYNGQTVPGNFVYTDETGAIVNKQSALSVGTHTLTATFTPTDTTYYTSGGTILRIR